MKLTTKKIDTSRYAVLADGRATGLYISKGLPAKYRDVQEWDVCRETDDRYLFSCKGLGVCVEAMQTVVGAALDAGARIS